jgi:FSR family fosmidomycin resistance protein-like MFS transporter
MCQGAVPALVPFLLSERDMTLSQTGLLLLVMTVGSSVLQPVFGYLADRSNAAWLMPAGLLVAACGIATLGIFDEFSVDLLGVGLGGLGVGAFHPEAARIAGRPDGAGVATSLGVFAVGGNAGFALAPALLTPAVLLWRLPGAAVVLVPAALSALWLTRVAAGVTTGAGRSAEPGPTAGPTVDRWGPLAVLGAVASLRSGVYFGLQSFIAVYFVRYLATSETVGNAALTVLLVAGAAGTLAGGRLADRFRTRLVLVGFLVAIAPLLAVFLTTRDLILAFPLLACVGFVTIGNFSLTVVMGQHLLPSRPGLASGITLGLAIGVGGLIAAALGPLAQRVGVDAVLWGLLGLPILAAALAVALPDRQGQTGRVRHGQSAAKEIMVQPR